MVTRRDAFLQNLNEAGVAARQRMAAPPAGQAQQRGGGQADSLSSQLQRGLSGIEAGITTLMRSGTSPVETAAYTSSSTPQPRAGPSSPRSTGPASPSLASVRTGPPEPGESDELPGYSRRPPSQAPQVPPSLRAPAIGNLPIREHRIVSRNAKLECVVQSISKASVPVFIRDLADVIRGDITVRLEKPEPISAVRIRLKVVVRCVIHRTPGGAQQRHPIIDEHLLLEMGETVWEAPPGQGDVPRLQGVHSFPYEFRLPNALRYGNQTLELPPSFALSANEYMTGNHEVASIKYYLKGTLARQGLFRPNDRLFAPLIFLQRHDRPSLPFERAAAIDCMPGYPPMPGPALDAANWQGRHGARDVRKGLFSGKRGSLEATLLLPLPHSYGTRTPVTFCLRVTSDDAGLLPPTSGQGVRVDLVQRTNILAQGLDAIYETGVGNCSDLRLDPEGGGVGNERRYRGTIVPTPSRTPGFASVGLQVSHAVVATIGDLVLVVPVSIKAWPPLRTRRSSTSSVTPSTTAARGEAEEVENAAPPDLPPSYVRPISPLLCESLRVLIGAQFEVMEQSDRKGSAAV